MTPAEQLQQAKLVEHLSKQLLAHITAPDPMLSARDRLTQLFTLITQPHVTFNDAIVTVAYAGELITGTTSARYNVADIASRIFYDNDTHGIGHDLGIGFARLALDAASSPENPSEAINLLMTIINDEGKTIDDKQMIIAEALGTALAIYQAVGSPW